MLNQSISFSYYQVFCLLNAIICKIYLSAILLDCLRYILKYFDKIVDCELYVRDNSFDIIFPSLGAGSPLSILFSKYSNIRLPPTICMRQ